MTANSGWFVPDGELAVQASNSPELDAKHLAAARLDIGMVTMVDPADIPEGALQYGKNATVRFDRTSRRSGSSLYGPAKPDSLPVMKLATLKLEDGTAYTVRITTESVYSLTVGPAWTEVVGTLAGTVSDKIQTAVVIDATSGVHSKLVFSNNGANAIQLIDFGLMTFDDLTVYRTAKYRYVTGFYNRVVGAANMGVNEVELAWSGDANIAEWDPSADETAGYKPLIDSPSDLSDFITGIFGYTNVMVIMREKSVWLASKQPIPTDPFYCYSAVPGIGCDSPYSITNIGSGLAWIDRRTKAVYAYIPGSQPESIGLPIEKNILNNVDDPKLIFAGYNPQPQEYTIYIPAVGSKLIAAWTYNLRNKAWMYNEYYDIVSTNDTDLATGGIRIDDLIGIIDDLQGTINDLSPTNEVITTRVYGRNDGTLANEDVNVAKDAPHTDYPNGIPYTTELISKTFEAEVEGVDLLVADISIEYIAYQGGTFQLMYSRNGGDSWVLAKTFTPTILGKARLLQFKKAIRCRRFAWKLVFNDGLFDILAYIVNAYPSGQSSNRPTL